MRQSSVFKYWVGGANSLAHPADLSPQEYAWGENVVHRGGIVQNRPGSRVVGSIAGAKLQGFCYFQPRNLPAQLIAAVDGDIYVGTWPGFAFTKLPAASFNPLAEFVVFQAAVKSTEQDSAGVLRLITPTPVLIIQDGETPPAVWDGTALRRLSPGAPKKETPIGLWMAWVSSRLWVSNGNRVFVGDIADPTKFTETDYLAERGNFDLPGDCTGLLETADEKGLLAFTLNSTTAFKSYIHDRPAWQTTPEFQKVIIPGIGCVGGRAACNQYGSTYWLSENGLVSLNVALFSQRDSKLDTTDGGVMRSKRNLAPYLGGAALHAFENYLLASVPAGDRYNAHTWAMDQSPTGGGTRPTWCGIWSGWRPAQWARGRIGGRARCYFASYDYTALNDTHIHIWEAFLDSREDEGGKISCQFETGFLSGEKLLKFKYAEIECVEILGDVTLDIFVGGTRGPWAQVGSVTLQAEKGSIGGAYQATITEENILEAYKPQSRTVQTEEFTPPDAEPSPETKPDGPGNDKGFQLLLEWRGRMGVREVRFIYDADAAKTDKGRCVPTEAAQHNAVTERGEVITA